MFVTLQFLSRGQEFLLRQLHNFFVSSEGFESLIIIIIIIIITTFFYKGNTYYHIDNLNSLSSALLYSLLSSALLWLEITVLTLLIQL